MIKQYTDEDFLYMFFSDYLHRMYDTTSTEGLLNIGRDGFDEPLDPNYLAPFVYDLAGRLGYKLVDNMWRMENASAKCGSDQMRERK